MDGWMDVFVTAWMNPQAAQRWTYEIILFCSLSIRRSSSCSFQWRCAMLLVMSLATSPSLLLQSHLPTLSKVLLFLPFIFRCGFFLPLSYSIYSCLIIAIQLWSPSSTQRLLSLSLDSRFPCLCGCLLPLLSLVILNSVLWYYMLAKLLSMAR